uniref:Uncharacterized protein n=1 Tax=Anopheles culicifacies TaxID=139723 RepID=A0A182M601_9DIPT
MTSLIASVTPTYGYALILLHNGAFSWRAKLATGLADEGCSVAASTLNASSRDNAALPSCYNEDRIDSFTIMAGIFPTVMVFTKILLTGDAYFDPFRIPVLLPRWNMHFLPIGDLIMMLFVVMVFVEMVVFFVIMVMIESWLVYSQPCSSLPRYFSPGMPTLTVSGTQICFHSGTCTSFQTGTCTSRQIGLLTFFQSGTCTSFQAGISVSFQYGFLMIFQSGTFTSRQIGTSTTFQTGICCFFHSDFQTSTFFDSHTFFQSSFQANFFSQTHFGSWWS